jgi:cardiolipin synthase
MIPFIRKYTKLFDTYFPPYERRLTIPTFLTGIRFVLTPCIAACLWYEQWILGLVFFCVSALTDVLDGFIARRYNQCTKLGACLDPLADKFLVIVVLMTLALKKNPYVAIPLWFVGIVIIKDFLIIAGAVFIACIHHAVSVKPTALGKVTMHIQVGALIWFVIASYCGYSMPFVHNCVMGLVIFFSVASLVHYVYNGWVIFNQRPKN